MGTAREWMSLHEGVTRNPLDFVLVPSSMGQATSVALGLALARPDLRVVVCTGDGSLLMNLGTLVSITAEAPPNLVVLLFDNGVYEVTGAQPTPGAAVARSGGTGVDFASLARGAGFRSVYRFSQMANWRAEAREVMDSAGPVFVVLDVAPVVGAGAPHAPRDGSARERAEHLRTAIAGIPTRQLFSVRRAVSSDATDVHHLIELNVESGLLLPRSESFVAENAAHFVVAVEGGAGERIIGCGHLEDYAPSLAELRSLAVHPARQGMGVGRAVAAAVEELARRRGYRTLFAVSNDEPFFLRCGFERRDIPELDRERSAVSKFKGVYAKTLG
jgi:phosphonopyruvate decarboxylase